MKHHQDVIRLPALPGGRQAGRQGFALVELLVAIALFGLIASALILAYGRARDQLFVTNAAYAVALSFRETQSYGVSVKQTEGGAFNAGYGLHFDTRSATTFLRFADAANPIPDFLYEGTDTTLGCLSGGECQSVFRLERGTTIAKFCGVISDDGGRDKPDSEKHEECSKDSTPPGNPGATITSLDVTFLRPNPDATIRTSRSVDGGVYKAARVYLVSPNNDMRVVEVVTTGQISVK